MRIDWLRRVLTGLAAGDSLGSTSEFKDRSRIPGLYNEVSDKGWPFKQVGGGIFGWQPGDPTDDTEMAMCIVRPFLRSRSFNPNQIAQEFISWMRSGPRDIGITTRRALHICETSGKYWEGGIQIWKENPRSAANGSLMRNGVISPMADRLDDAFSMTLKHGMITHYAPLPQICCLAHSYLIWELLHQTDSPLSNWISKFKAETESYLTEVDDPDILEWLSNVKGNGSYDKAMSTFENAEWDMDKFNPFTIHFNGADGYCLLTLRIAIWGLHWSWESNKNFETPEGFPPEVFEVMGSHRLAWIAMCGHDSDTYSAVAGALIAAAHRELPAGMIDGLKVLKELVNPL